MTIRALSHLPQNYLAANETFILIICVNLYLDVLETCPSAPWILKWSFLGKYPIAWWPFGHSPTYPKPIWTVLKAIFWAYLLETCPSAHWILKWYFFKRSLLLNDHSDTLPLNQTDQNCIEVYILSIYDIDLPICPLDPKLKFLPMA